MIEKYLTLDIKTGTLKDCNTGDTPMFRYVSENEDTKDKAKELLGLELANVCFERELLKNKIEKIEEENKQLKSNVDGCDAIIEAVYKNNKIIGNICKEHVKTINDLKDRKEYLENVDLSNKLFEIRLIVNLLNDFKGSEYVSICCKNILQVIDR